MQCFGLGLYGLWAFGSRLAGFRGLGFEVLGFRAYKSLRFYGLRILISRVSINLFVVQDLGFGVLGSQRRLALALQLLEELLEITRNDRDL